MKRGGLGKESAQACLELAKKLVYQVLTLIWKKLGLTQRDHGAGAQKWRHRPASIYSSRLLYATGPWPFLALRSERID